ncbi:Gfo/Idh/MocA family oxidoreductase [soil metagenome]
MALRLIHIGVGGWGLDWEKNVLPLVDTIERVAAVDASPAILKELQTEVGISPDLCFNSLPEALAKVQADAVLVTVPLKWHIPVAIEALELGLHALVEKPFAPTIEEARQAIAVAERNGKTLAVSQNYRFFSAPRAVAEIVKSGELGAVGQASVDFRRHVTASAGGHRHFTLADPLLVDMAIHHFDLMRLVLGQDPVNITCRTWNPSWSPFTDDAAGSAVVEFDGGAHVAWRGSWVSPGPETNWAGEWRVEFAEGEVVWTARGNPGDQTLDSVIVRPSGKPEKKLALSPLKLHGRRGSIASFAKAIADGVEPENSAKNNLLSLASAYGAVESAKTKDTVLLNV